MAEIFQTIVSNVFSWMKMYEFRLRFHEVYSQGSNWQYSSIGSGNGLAPSRRQAIIWTDDGIVYWRIYASLSLNDLTHWSLGDFNLTWVDGGLSISHKIALRWMPLDLSDDKSTLVQVMAWCHQATSHYLSQCWPRSMSLNGVIRP